MAITGDFVGGQTVSFQKMRALLMEQGGGIQEGVVSAGDLMVTQRGSGVNQSVDVAVGAAWVQIDTGTRSGMGHGYSDAVANVALTAANGTNPRIDQAVLQWNDSSLPTGSGNIPTLTVLTGTATAGATLANRTGATALPNDTLRLADILVPALSTTVSNTQIRDRRQFAKGAYAQIQRTSANYTTASASVADVDATNLKPRLECSGAPLRVTLRAAMAHTVLNAVFDVIHAQDGVALNGSAASQWQLNQASANANDFKTVQWDTVPSAGSHLFGPQFAIVTAGTLTLLAVAANPLEFVIEEIVRPNAVNNTQTSG
jgi:hypothetical protein